MGKYNNSRALAKRYERPDLSYAPTAVRLDHGTKPRHTSYLAHLRSVILDEASSTHCVATTLQGYRCGRDITDRSFTEATKLVNLLGADSVANERILRMVAEGVCCKQARLGHRTQAGRVMRRWIRAAKEVDMGARVDDIRTTMAMVSGNMSSAASWSIGNSRGLEASGTQNTMSHGFGRQIGFVEGELEEEDECDDDYAPSEMVG